VPEVERGARGPVLTPALRDLAAAAVEQRKQRRRPEEEEE
jgi:hypothetical protein